MIALKSTGAFILELDELIGVKPPASPGNDLFTVNKNYIPVLKIFS